MLILVWMLNVAFGASIPTELPSAIPSEVTLTPAQMKEKLSELDKQYRSNRAAQEHRNRVEFKELEASQKARQKDWNQNEKQARREFFKKNTKGADRRTYIQEFMKRRSAYLQSLKDEKKTRAVEHAARLDSIKAEFEHQRSEFTVKAPASATP